MTFEDLTFAERCLVKALLESLLWDEREDKDGRNYQVALSALKKLEKA